MSGAERHAPCPDCGSTTSRLGARSSRCGVKKGCESRRMRRRKQADRKASGDRRQCMAILGKTSIRFCVLRVGHGGPHLNAETEWTGEGASAQKVVPS